MRAQNSTRKLSRPCGKTPPSAKPLIFVKESRLSWRNASRCGRANELQQSSCRKRDTAARTLCRDRSDGSGVSLEPFDLVRGGACGIDAPDGIFLSRYGA